MHLDLAELHRDPYPTYAKLRQERPVVWVESLRCWWVTRYADVRAIMLDDRRFTTVSARSPAMDAFGPQMLSSDGPDHHRYRLAAQPAFTPAVVRERYEALVEASASSLIDTLIGCGEADLRRAFASRLPVRVMLAALGLPDKFEPQFRAWYDVFEARLADSSGQASLSYEAHGAAADLRDVLEAALFSPLPPSAILAGTMRQALADQTLTAQEISRNLSIIVFGGISTVEALILNTLWALFGHPQQLSDVQRSPELMAAAVEETMRWVSPVQSATRFAVADVNIEGVTIAAGDKIGVMLAAANRDSEVFLEPDEFSIYRANARKHLGFAVGPHLCLGSHLARAQARIALSALIFRLPNLRVHAAEVDPEGFEFRQPRALRATWSTATGGIGGQR